MGFDPIDKWYKLTEPADIGPNLRIVGVEYMRSVFVHEHVGRSIPFGEAISADMSPLIKNENAAFTEFHEFTGEYGTGEPGSNYGVSWHV